MTNEPELVPISDADLAEQWFSLRNKTWRAVTAAVRASGIDQKKLADRIGMDAGQFNKIVTGRRANLTLRILHKLARAVNHRLQISLVPLSSLPKPNYNYEARNFRIATKSTSSMISGRRTEMTATTSQQPQATSGVLTKVLEPEFVP